MTSNSLRLREGVAFINAEHVQAIASALPFLTRPPSECPSGAPLGLGPLQYIIDVVRQEYDRDPTRALALTSLVLDRGTNLCVPAGYEAYRQRLLGRAWKEHANAL